MARVDFHLTCGERVEVVEFDRDSQRTLVPVGVGLVEEEPRVALDAQSEQRQHTDDQHGDAPTGSEDPSDDQARSDVYADHQPEGQAWDEHNPTLRNHVVRRRM